MIKCNNIYIYSYIILIEVAKALGLRKDTDGSTTEKQSNKSNNSRCEVCTGTGELLCCDTCPLVFHLHCMRPKLNAIPDNATWSCPYCIINGVVSSKEMSFSDAKISVATMAMLSRGLDITPEEIERDNKDRITDGKRCHEVTVQRSGKRFVVKRTAKAQIIELDRCSTLGEALVSVVSELNHPATHKKNKFDNDELWCTHCLDDTCINLCAFCGCRKCYGKHDSDKLLVCDGCDEEYHTYCLSKPVDTIPNATWFCNICTSAGKHQSKGDKTSKINSSQKKSNKDDKSNSGDDDVKNASGRPRSLSTGGTGTGRGRGRPPGSSSKKKQESPNAAAEKEKSSSSKISAEATDGDNATTLIEGTYNSFAYRGGGPQESPEKTPEAPPTLGPPGYDDAYDIINGKHYYGDHTSFHQTEKELFNNLRQWAPLGDLESTRDALLAQRDEVCKRIAHLDPFFKFAGLTTVLGGESPCTEENDDIGMIISDLSHEKVGNSSNSSHNDYDDVGNTDELIDNGFELDAGNAASVAAAEKALSPRSRAKQQNIVGSEYPLKTTVSLENMHNDNDLLFSTEDMAADKSEVIKRNSRATTAAV